MEASESIVRIVMDLWSQLLEEITKCLMNKLIAVIIYQEWINWLQMVEPKQNQKRKKWTSKGHKE